MLNIRRVRTKAFRGIKDELEIPLDGKSLIVFGENGTGKSSFLQAIEHALTGEVLILTGTQGLSYKKFGPHANAKPKDVIAEVSIGNGEPQLNCTAVNGRVISESSDAQAYVSAASDKAFILRRKQLLAFVDAQEAERYKALAPFLGLSDFASIEQELKHTAEQASNQAELTNRRLDNHSHLLRERFGITGITDLTADIHSQLAARALQLSIQQPEIELNLEELVDQLKELTSGRADTVRLTAVQMAIDKLQELSVERKAEHLQECASAIKAALEVERELKATFIAEVLTSGKSWIEQDKVDECPLCEHAIDRDVVLARIDERLAEHENVQVARQRRADALQAVRTYLRTLLDAYKALKFIWLKAAGPGSWPFARVYNDASKLTVAAYEAGDASNYQELDSLLRTKELDETIVQMLEMLRTIQEATTVNESNKEAVKLLLDVQHVITEIPLNIDLAGKRSIALKVEECCKGVYEAAVGARKYTSEQILKSIQTRITQIFEAFHESETILFSAGQDSISLTVNPDRRGSATLEATFAGTDAADPRAYYSESHLDSLGLAIFLAMRERVAKLKPHFKLIILDDVLSSIDAPHRRRIARFIMDTYGSEFQLIITTHDRIWFNYLVDGNLAPRERFLIVKFTKWTLGRGPHVLGLVNDRDKLHTSIGERDAQELASEAGRFLESDLLELRYSLELAVPARRGETYTIGDILPKLMKVLKKCEALWLPVGPACERLNGSKIRNYGSHGEEWMRDLSDSEAKDFAEAVLEFGAGIRCQECSNVLRIIDGPKCLFMCKCGKLRHE